MKIAIVGMGQIGKSIALKAREAEWDVVEYSRSLFNIPGFSLGAGKYPEDTNIIVNCVGEGDPLYAYNLSLALLENFMEIDNEILNHLRLFPETKYAYISSWVANLQNVHGMKQNYAVYKRYMELRHELFNVKAKDWKSVYDLRVPAFFSRFFKVDSGFLIGAILRNILLGDPIELQDPLALFEYKCPHGLFDEVITQKDTKSWFCTREDLYHSIKRVVFGDRSIYLSSEFQDELNILLGAYYAKNPEKLDNILVGPVSYKDEPQY